MERFGIRTVIPERAVFDAMRWEADLREKVVVADLAASGRIVSLERLRRYLAGRTGWIGVNQVREALLLASDRVRSPAETRLRLLWTRDAGLPEPLVNWTVSDRTGRFLAEVDLLDPVAGLVGEYDGADHRSGARHARDVVREDALRRVGLEVVTVTGRDLARPGSVVERIQAAKARAGQIPASSRTFLIKMAPKSLSRRPG